MGDERACFLYDPADINWHVEQIQNILIAERAPIYRRGLYLVRPEKTLLPYTSLWTESGKIRTVPTHAWQLVPYTSGSLRMMLSKYVKFTEATKKGPMTIEIPPTIVKALLDPNTWKFPPIDGIVSVPIIRADNSLILKSGYDPEARVWLDLDGLDLSGLKEHPTRQEAEAALAILLELIEEFKFTSDTDRGVAIAALLTAVARRSVRSAPMPVISATTRGSGKTLLVSTISTIACGHVASPFTAGGRQEEFEKRLDSALLSGELIINIDNFSSLGGVKSDTLCAALTSESMTVRVFGSLERERVSNCQMLFLNGNNIPLASDLDRRVLFCEIDPQVERPELVDHDFDPLEWAEEHRSLYVKACLTILLAYDHRNKPDPDCKVTILRDSFKEWCYRVLAPLVWLAPHLDPIKSFEKARDRNQDVKAEIEFKQEWYNRGLAPLTAKDIKMMRGDNPAFEFFREFSESRNGMIDGKRLDYKLGAIANRPSGGLILSNRAFGKGHGGGVKWGVIKA